MAPDRPNQLKILVSDDELRMLRELAERDGVTASDYVRLFIREEYKQIIVEKQGFGPAPRRTRSRLKK